MKSREDLSGNRYGRWEVLYRVRNDRFICKCDCGTVRSVLGSSLVNGTSKSCGCYAREKTSIRNKQMAKHNETNSRLYSIWRGMKKRCYQKTSYGYERYGGRGITVCDEWKNDYLVFRKWAMENGYSDNLTIDRINSDDGYYPDNCRFVDYYVQENNRSNNHFITYRHVTLTLAQWCRLTNSPKSTMLSRVNKFGEEKAIDMAFEKRRECAILTDDLRTVGQS